jgi:hypothetical protein
MDAQRLGSSRHGRRAEEEQMELTIRIEDLLRGHGAEASRDARPRAEARPRPRPLEAVYAGILDAALTRDFAALRAYGARMAEETTEAPLDASLFASSAFE